MHEHHAISNQKLFDCIFNLHKRPVMQRAFHVMLSQLERLRSEDTHRRPMITPYYWPVYFESQVHIIEQLISDPKSKQGESRKIRKISEKLKF